MGTCIVLFAAVAVASGCEDRPSLVAIGGDRARGTLVNYTPGFGMFDPPDPDRPTVVFIHGINPVPRAVHFTMSERLAAALARRFGAAFNLLGWDWNAASFVSVRPWVNDENAVEQGHALAAALRGAGGAPSRTHLIGHSSGCIVAASAARDLAAGGGEPPAQLTLLEPATLYHALVFDHLAAGSSARKVENYWSPGPSGYGREAPFDGIWNVRVAGPMPHFGVICPLRSSHLFVVEWYLATVEDQTCPSGFNTSLLLQEVGQ
jgi:pimeloyl-ACP methyl ester carboxylesterase